MISITNLSYYLGDRALYESASWHIKPKDKIGLIGLNGTGKSTLLRLIVGEYQADGGTISKSGECTIGFLNQDHLSYLSDESILAVAMQAFERANVLQVQLDEILHEMEINYHDALIDKLARVQEEFEALDGYSLQAKSEEILEGLGFSTDDLHKPLRQFSGGWRMRVMLAKMLLQKPALLMLDEPTNHLDLPSIKWVEKYVENYEGAVIVVSHDREFLDNVSNCIVEISNQKFNYYGGNYSFYLEEKALRNEIQQGAYENQQSKIKQTERFIERFKAKATKAKQAQSRAKMLDKMDRIDAVIDENAKVHFRFQFATQPGRNILHLEDVSKSYGDKHILSKTDIAMERGDKIALIGANGKGKSTVLRIVAGGEEIDGTRRLGHNVKFTFFAQHQLEALNIENTILDELKYANPTKSETECRTILGCFLFSGDDAFKKIKVLSGGEKSRVALAKVLVSEANFLLLDEPTNHLDIQSVNILIQALQQYEGSYIVVSHDRYFVEATANKIWYIEDREVKQYPGSYQEYEMWNEDRKLESQNTGGKPQSSGGKQEVKLEKHNAIHKSSVTKPTATKSLSYSDTKIIQQKIDKIELKISELEKQKAETETKLAVPDIYGNPTKLSEINRLYTEIKAQLNKANDDWEAAVTELEG
jgi:ATP-binding cassette, subfamily F, member 3